jgi:hypothetical protein
VKKLFCLLVFILCVFLSQAQDFKFLEIEWNSSRSVVKVSLEKNYFTFLERQGKDEIYSGSILNIQSEVYCMYSNDKLVTIGILIKAPSNNIIDEYREIKSIFMEKWGQPQDKNEYFDPTFDREGGRRDSIGITIGKIVLYSFWENKEKTQTIDISVNELCNILVIYRLVSSWEAEVKNRRVAF